MRDPEALQVGPGAVARLRSPILIKTPISFPYSRLRSLLPSARRRMDELPGPSHREGASESVPSDAVPSPNERPGSAAGRAGCGGATPEPDVNNNPHVISIVPARQPLSCFEQVIAYGS